MSWPFARAPVLIRPLRRGDEEACAKLHKVGFAHAWSAAEFGGLIVSSSVAGEAALLRGVLAGFVLSRQAADEAEILTLVVQPNRRRTGIGGELMKAHLGRLAAFGVGSVLLEVDARNTAARALYFRLGFESVGVRQGYYRQGVAEHSDALILRVRL